MRKPVFILATLVAVVAAPATGVANAQEAGGKAQSEQPKAASPAPAQASEKDPGGAARSQAPGAPRPPRTKKIFVGEFRALDLDKKTLTFETDDGKSYTLEAQVPTLPDAVGRAAQLAQILKPGDRIRMLCRVDEKEEPTRILTLHMMGSQAPMQYR